MDFTFSKDELLLRDAVSRFLMTEAAPEMLREIWETDSGRSPEMRRKIAAQGLTALSVPEAEGGLGMGDVAWALMTQELGYFAISDSLADTAYLAAGLLCALPQGHALRATWLPRIADGSCRIALGHPINPLVADAHLADLLLLAHPTPLGLELHAVARADVTVTQHRSIDASRRLGAVQWTATPATLIAAGALGQAVWDTSQERGALCVAGQLIGLAQRMLNISVDYAAQRTQFGKPIGSFQVTQHKFADMKVMLDTSFTMVRRYAWLMENGKAERADTAVIKYYIAESYKTISDMCLQILGGYGYSMEYPMQRFFRDSRLATIGGGTSEIQKNIIASTLGL